MKLTSLQCPFCHHEVLGVPHIFRCEPCHINLMVEDYDHNEINDIIFIHYESNYNIQIRFFDNKTILYDRGYAHLPIVMLDYIADVTPQNINEWIERLLKLKAFS